MGNKIRTFAELEGGRVMAKEIRKTYRMTQEQAARLKEKAVAAGMSEAEYFRVLITQEPMDYPEIREGIHGLVNEVNRIGVNINEIVHNNNSYLYKKTDKERIVAYMRKLNDSVERVVEALGNH
mgnify:CR=1 FL=1